jgi:hypothetical protein
MATAYSPRREILVAVAVGLVALGCGGSPRSAPGLEEVSANFDLADVRPFLSRVSAVLDSGFGEAEVDQLVSQIGQQAVDSEQTYDFTVTFDGHQGTLRVTALMDDVGAPDMAFYAPPTLAARIDSLLRGYLQEREK